MNEIEVNGKKLKVVTTFLQHADYDLVKFQYGWHKKMVSNPKIFWNIENFPADTTKPDNNEDVLVINVKDGRTHIDKIFAESFIYFQIEDPDYYMFFGWDAFIIQKDFEMNSVSYMEKHKIFGLFPWLHSKWSDPTHPFVTPMPDLAGKQWGVMEGIIFHKEALKYYYESLFHPPLFWMELRIPSVLSQAGFHITSNPYMDWDYFRHLKDASLTYEQVKEGANKKTGAMHPIKDYNLLKMIK